MGNIPPGDRLWRPLAAFALLTIGIGSNNVASATTLPNWNQSDLARITDALIVAVVERVTVEQRETDRLWLHLRDVQTLYGDCIACAVDEVRVRLSPEYFPQADAAIGNQVLLRVMDRDAHLSIRGGWRAILREEEGRTLTARRDPVLDSRCDTVPIVARPNAERPEGEGVLTSPTRVFVEEPLLEAEAWADTLARLAGCPPSTNARAEVDDAVR